MRGPLRWQVPALLLFLLSYASTCAFSGFPGGGGGPRGPGAPGGGFGYRAPGGGPGYNPGGRPYGNPAGNPWGSPGFGPHGPSPVNPNGQSFGLWQNPLRRPTGPNPMQPGFDPASSAIFPRPQLAIPQHFAQVPLVLPQGVVPWLPAQPGMAPRTPLEAQQFLHSHLQNNGQLSDLMGAVSVLERAGANPACCSLIASKR